jgi:hypothetical protein
MSVFETKKNATSNFLLKKIQEIDTRYKSLPLETRIEGKPSFWAISQTLWALLESGLKPSDVNIKVALDYILCCRNKSGAWPEPGAAKRDAVFQTACGIITLHLLASSDKQIEEALSQGVNRLAQLQTDEGGWGYIEGDQCRVRPTAVAVLALSTVYRDMPAFRPTIKNHLKNGIKWLEMAQNADNGWGSSSCDNQSSSITGWVIWALSNSVGLDFQVNAEKIRKGLAWLIGHQQFEGSWLAKDEGALIIDSQKLPPIYGVDTPLMILALLRSCESDILVPSLCDSILKGVYWLLHREEEKTRYWVDPSEIGGYIRENDALQAEEMRRNAKPNIWATAYCLLTLDRFEKLHSKKPGCFIDMCLRNFKKVSVLEGLPT